MRYDKKIVADKLIYWKHFMEDFHLPDWEELPDLELYMDQVVSLICRYTNLRPHEPEREPVLTPSAVNNYVRLRLIPPPVKKRYNRVHLAHLVVICCLKSSVSLANIGKMFPAELDEERTRLVYTDFIRQYRDACMHCVEQMESLSQPVLDAENSDENTVNRLVLSSAVAGMFYLVVTEKLLALGQQPEQDKKPNVT